MSAKTIKEIMEEGQLNEGNEANEGTEDESDGEPGLFEGNEANEGTEDEDLGLFDEEYEEGFCEACGSADLEVRPSGLIICNSCNHIDRRNYDVEED